MSNSSIKNSIDHVLLKDPPKSEDRDGAIAQLRRLSAKQLANLCEDLDYLLSLRNHPVRLELTKVYNSRRAFYQNVRRVQEVANQYRVRTAEERGYNPEEIYV